MKRQATVKAVPCPECNIYYAPVQCKVLECPVCEHSRLLGNLLLDMRRLRDQQETGTVGLLKEPEAHERIDTHA